MPTYEYICEKCGIGFEVTQSMKDAHLEICPKDKCPKARWGKGVVKRAIGGGAGLIFKGSGFYITDYRSENYKTAAKKDSESLKPSSEASKPAASTDSGTKPAAKEKKPAAPGKKKSE